MTNIKKLPLLIFDLDGTLINSAQDIHVALNQMLKKYDRSSVTLDVLISHIGDGLLKLVNDFFPEYHINSTENLKLVDEFLSLYSDEHLTTFTHLYEGVDIFLKTYPGPIGLITNKDINPTLKILKHFDLHNLNWTQVIGGDSLTEKKPSPLGLNTIMKKTGYTPENTWMIGDGRPDMISAANAGCKKIAVHYGYSKPEELSVYNPDFILNKFIDIESLIR